MKKEKMKFRVLSFITAVFGILLFFSLAACENPFMAALLKDKEEPETPETPVVTVPVTGVTLSPSTLTLTVGDMETFTATVLPIEATNKTVSWSSSAPSVATVNNGVVTTVAVGTATITVTTADGGHTAICNITVIPVADAEDFGPGAFTITRTFNVSNLGEWNDAVSTISSGGGNKNYIINVIADIPSIAGATATPPTPTFGTTVTGITVSLRGDKTLSLAGNGSLIRTAAGQTVILRGLTLEGHASNDTSLVYVFGTNSAFVMHGGKISDNTTSSDNGGGVMVNGGTFTMRGGEISGNKATDTWFGGGGGGVCVSLGTFTMHSGKISGNYAMGAMAYGGGVYIGGSGTFTMNGGEISGNTTMEQGNGGGVMVNGGTFTMNGGEISGNTAGEYGQGGGVCVGSGTFTMQSGEVQGNSAGDGGGVRVMNGTFRLVTGTIYGNTEADESLRNTATYDGSALNKNTYGTATYGPNGTGTDLTTTDNTIRVVNGVME